MNQAVDKFGCLNNTIKVFAGHYVDLANPDPTTIEIKSIASALSKICRFGGHCPRFYSVAEHCIHATSLAIDGGVPITGLRAVLLHDAAEAYIGDMVKPLKVMMPDYAIAELRMEQAIESAFSVDFEAYHKTIKKYDRAMLKAEKTKLWPKDSEQWAGFSEIPDVSVPFKFWEPRVAEVEFIAMARAVGLSAAATTDTRNDK
jgi:5'-deoxynucleotidase YfbR-like HD superfamily hydrolase